jgi:hypothetical protein
MTLEVLVVIMTMMNVEIFWDYYAMSTGKKLLLDSEDEVTVLI